MMSPTAPANRVVVLETIAFHGWSNNLRLSNGVVELVITLDVGPRILSYAKVSGASPLKIYPENAGGRGEPTWLNRGGHRLWLAPEKMPFTYCPDNAPVAWERLGPLSVRVTPPMEEATGFQKQLDISLDATGTGVTIVHRAIRTAAQPHRVALWALTVMAPGGVAIVPQPPMGEHPRDMLPNRLMVVWPYTDLSDPRWHFGRQYITLQQDTARGATKMGIAQKMGWAGYLWRDLLFVKRFGWRDAEYPDSGCNFEVFSNADMLEVESLGPLITLQRDELVEHTETWELYDGLPPCNPRQDEEIKAALSAFLS